MSRFLWFTVYLGGVFSWTHCILSVPSLSTHYVCLWTNRKSDTDCMIWLF